MSWKEKRLITILSIILAVLCAAVLVVLSIRYRAAQAAKDQNTVSPSDIAEAAQSEYVALSYSNGNYMEFITHPISGVFLAIALFSLIFNLYHHHKRIQSKKA